MATAQHVSRAIKIGFSHLEDGESVKTSKMINGVDPEATVNNMMIAILSVGDMTTDSILSKGFVDTYEVFEDDEEE